MKRIFFIFAAFFVTFATMAQQTAPQQYSVRYLKEHLLLQKGDEVNVVDVNLEWPEVLDFSQVEVLKQHLARTAFALPDGGDFETDYERFKSHYGQPVTKQFEVVPDDKKFCYIDVSVTLLGRLEHRFAAFEVRRTVQPEALSSQKADTINQLVTIDLQNNRILLRDNILKASQMSHITYDGRDVLLLPMETEEFPDMMIEDACLLDENRVLTKVGLFTDEGVKHLFAIAEREDLGSLLVKDVRRLMTSQPKTADVNFDNQENMETLNGEPIYNNVEERPRPNLREGTTLPQFLQANASEPKYLFEQERHGRVVVSFVVSKTGEMSDFRVRQPLTAAADREAVRILRQLPQWTPATIGGQAVNCRNNIVLKF